MFWEISLLLIMVIIQETYSSSGGVFHRAKQETLSSVIPIDRIVNTFLEKSKSHVFYLLREELQTHPLSVTIIPCSGPVQWSIKHRVNPGPVNVTEILRNAENDNYIFRGSELQTWSEATAQQGLYLISATATEVKTHFQIFASMDPGGPYDLSIHQEAKMRAFTMRRRRLLVRWEPSLLNPHNITYCIVINPRRWYPKLCEAEREVAESNVTDVKIECVRQKTHVILSRMEKNRTYFLNLFAVNFRTGLSVFYGNISIKYDAKVQPLVLRDGKPKSGNLRKHEGRMSFRFHAASRTKELHMYVMSCGGSVFAQIMNRGVPVTQKERVNGYYKFKILKPKRGEYYSLKITATDPDELMRIKSVEAFATQYPSTRYPLPELPSEPEVYEYVSLRNCTSVTIGWVPTVDVHPARYCVYAREILRRATDSPYSQVYQYDVWRMSYPEQCGLDRHIKYTATRLASQKCGFMSNGNAVTVTTHNITDLKPGKSYHVQVTVKKQKGRTLSYNFLQVHTKQFCV